MITHLLSGLKKSALPESLSPEHGVDSRSACIAAGHLLFSSLLVSTEADQD